MSKNWFLLLAAILLMSAPAFAHHSFASEFDLGKPITMTGTVTKVDWINPHCYMEMDVKDASGNVQHWNYEFGAPVGLRRAGMRQDMLQIGQPMTIDGYAAKDGTNLGWVSKFTFPDGRVIRVTGDAKDAPPAAK
jgi:Family of unknown function (DUF6152)